MAYSGRIAAEWNGYCGGWYWNPIEWLGRLGINLQGGINVNQEVMRLSQRLAKQGYNIPIVTDTDVHARTSGALDAIGTGRIEVDDIDFTSGRTIIDSLRRAVFAGDHQNTYRTVPVITHFIPYFAIPYLLNKIGIDIYKRPRG
jgi:hypothetical protein